jgi:hypothetical protein
MGSGIRLSGQLFDASCLCRRGQLMKQLVKELKQQAGIDFNPDQEGLDLFAELIVRECIDIVKPTQHHEAWAQSYLGGVDGLDLLYSKIKDIKKHFGVEE